MRHFVQAQIVQRPYIQLRGILESSDNMPCVALHQIYRYSRTPKGIIYPFKSHLATRDFMFYFREQSRMLITNFSIWYIL